MNGIISSIAMQQSSNVTTTSKISKNESVNAATDEGQSTATDTSVSSKYDTLELSQDYLTYKMKSENSTVADDTNLQNSMSDETQVAQKPMGPPPPPPTEEDDDSSETELDLLSILTSDDSETSDASIVTESTSTSTDSDSASDLSSYSESELKDMLSEGTITRAQYNAEIASRETESDSSKSTDQLPPPPPPEKIPANPSIGEISSADISPSDSTISEV